MLWYLHFEENGRKLIKLVNFELSNFFFFTKGFILDFNIPTKIASFPASFLAIL